MTNLLDGVFCCSFIRRPRATTSERRYHHNISRATAHSKGSTTARAKASKSHHILRGQSRRLTTTDGPRRTFRCSRPDGARERVPRVRARGAYAVIRARELISRRASPRMFASPSTTSASPVGREKTPARRPFSFPCIRPSDGAKFAFLRYSATFRAEMNLAGRGF